MQPGARIRQSNSVERRQVIPLAADGLNSEGLSFLSAPKPSDGGSVDNESAVIQYAAGPVSPATSLIFASRTRSPLNP
jgi:hypothetical protein